MTALSLQPTHQDEHRRRGAPAAAAACVIAVVTALVALAACGGGGGGKAHASTTLSTTRTTTPTTPIPSASTTTVQGPTGPPADYPAAQPQAPSLTGAYPTGSTVNLITVIKTLTTYRDWLYSHPNPGSVKNYMFTTGNDYASEVQNLTTLQRKGWHEDPMPTVIQWAKLTFAPAVTSYEVNGHRIFRGGSVTVVEDLTSAPYLNSSNQVVGHEPGGGLVAYSMTLAQETSGGQAPDGQFRIVDVTQLNPPGGIAALESQ
jgi:hypothetical protein